MKLQRHERPPTKDYAWLSQVLRDTAKETPELQAWKARTSPKDQERALKAAGERGKALHSDIERACNGYDGPATSGPYLHSIRSILDGVSRVLWECSVWDATHKLAARLDMLASTPTGLYVVDWKTSERPKREEWLHDAVVQVGAICKLTETTYWPDALNLAGGLVVVALGTAAPAQTVTVTREMIDSAWTETLIRLADYRQVAK